MTAFEYSTISMPCAHLHETNIIISRPNNPTTQKFATTRRGASERATATQAANTSNIDAMANMKFLSSLSTFPPFLCIYSVYHINDTVKTYNPPVGER